MWNFLTYSNVSVIIYRTFTYTSGFRPVVHGPYVRSSNIFHFSSGVRCESSAEHNRPCVQCFRRVIYAADDISGLLYCRKKRINRLDAARDMRVPLSSILPENVFVEKMTREPENHIKSFLQLWFTDNKCNYMDALVFQFKFQ